MAEPVRAQSRAEAQIRAVDAAFRSAMIRGDVRLLDRVIANDAKIIHGNQGGIQDKKGLIESFRGYHIDSYDRSPILLRISGDLAVMVSTTRKHAVRKTIETSTTEVFVHRPGRWQILVLQNTDHTPG